jgi:hypothetical protein
VRRAAIVLVVGLASTGTSAQPVSKPPAQEDRSTSAMWRPRRHVDLHWQLLMLPERIVSLVFLPLELLAGAIEEYRLDRRLNDFLTFHDGRITLSPRFKFSFGDGLGAGVWVTRSQLAGRNAELKVGGLARLNRDWQVEVEYDHRLLVPGGRGLRASAFLENDQNQRFYGIGGQTLEADRRVLASFDQGALAEIDLQGIDRYTYSGIAQLGFRRQALSPGVAPGEMPITTGDTVLPPPGFDDTATFIDVLVAGRYDSRDTAGRPTRGVFVEASALGRKEVTGKPLSAVTVSGTAKLHLPLLRDDRVLVLSLWGSAAMALSGDEIPFESLPVVGRSNVRGYDRERFRDRYALVGSAEYRFPIYEYLSSGAGLDAFAFFDAGTLWGTTAFSPDPLRYAVGGGLRGAHETKLVFETTIGWSPEGLQLNLGVEKAL